MQRPLRGLTRKNLSRELFAGITLLAISVPLNIGYAQIAGLPATAGLYALIIPTLVYVLTVSSRQVVAAPDAASAALVFSSLVGLGAGGDNLAAMAAAQAILSGLMFALSGLLKLGFLANFLSKPILIGFVGGLALDILISQVAKMLGISLTSGADFLEKVTGLFGQLTTANGWSVLISVVGVAILLSGRRIAPMLPWALVVLVLGTVATAIWHLEDHGVAVLGEVPAGLPQFSVPMLDIATWLSLIPSAIALTLVTVAEGLLISRSYAEQGGYRVRPNQDLYAYGAANVASGLSGAFSIGTSTSRTAAMAQLGSRTQLPSLVLVAGTLLLLLFGTSLLELIPSPAIGAVVAVAVLKLLGLTELRQLWHASRFEFGIGIACFAGVLLLGPLSGLLVAFVLSLINVTRRAANPAIDVLSGSEDPEDSLIEAAPAPTEAAPGVIVLRLTAPIFFANGAVVSDHITTLVTEHTDPVRAVVLDVAAVNDIDVTGAEALRGALAKLHGLSITVAITRMRPDIRTRFAHFGLLETVREFDTNRAALAALSTTNPEN